MTDTPGQVIVYFRDCEEPLRFPDCVAVPAGDRYLIVNTATQRIETRIDMEAVERIHCDANVPFQAKTAEVTNIRPKDQTRGYS